MDFPAQIKVVALDKKHPTLDTVCADLKLYDKLAKGGRELCAVSGDVLVRKERESDNMWLARQKRFEPDSPLAAAVTFYSGDIFKNEPTVDFGKDGAEDLGASETKFWDYFKEHADGESKRLPDLARETFWAWATTGRSWTLIDRPVAVSGVTSRAEETAPELAPYLVSVPATDVINWSQDADGLLHVTVSSIELGAFDLSTGEHEEKPTWIIYTREGWAKYQRRTKDDDFASKVDEGKHALSAHGVVPFIQMSVPADYWLADRAGRATVGYLNLDNEISMYLQAAMLVRQYVKTDDFSSWKQFNEDNSAVVLVDREGEAGYIELSGTSLGEAQARLDRKRDSCYRQCHLTVLSRGTNNTSDQAQSGKSKEMDFEPTKAVEEGYGDLLKLWYRGVTHWLFLAAGFQSPAISDIRGFRFVSDDLDTAVKALESVTSLGIPSDILRKALEKRVADRALLDEPEQTRNAAKDEIESAPPYEERQRKQREEEARTAVAAFGG